jgi:hypothetical protein
MYELKVKRPCCRVLGRCLAALQAACFLACSEDSSSSDTIARSGTGGDTASGGASTVPSGAAGRGGSSSDGSGGSAPTGGLNARAGTSAGGGAANGGVGGASTATAGGGNASAGRAGAATGEGGTSEVAAGAGQGGVSGLSGGAGSAGSAGNLSGGSGGSAGSAGSGGSDGKVVLFDGKNLDAWQSVNGGAARWQLLPDERAMEVDPGAGNLITKQKFGSMFLHVEYWTPAYPANVTGQSRGNSGIYVKRAYEFQVLDTFGAPPAIDTCGAIYETSAPLVSACFGAETWNTYEIEFRDSTWDDQSKTAPAVAVSVHLNGELVQENVRLTNDPTRAGTADAPGPQPLMLQDHDAQGRVRYRNIWLIPR